MTSVAEFYSGATILVTGATGFIGSALVNSLVDVECKILLLVRPGRNVNQRENTTAEIRSISGDIQDLETWKKSLEGIDYVFHFSAQTSGYTANNDPLSDLRTNVVPVIQLLKACQEDGLQPKVLFAGTVTQSGLPSINPMNEDAQDFPLTIYDIHKLTGEKYFHFYANEVGIPSVTLRLPNVYGPGSGTAQVDRGVFNRMIRDGINNKPLTVYGDG